MTKTEELREKVAQELFILDGGYPEDWLKLQDSEKFNTKKEYRFKVDKILKACKDAGLVFEVKGTDIVEYDKEVIQLRKLTEEIEL